MKSAVARSALLVTALAACGGAGGTAARPAPSHPGYNLPYVEARGWLAWRRDAGGATTTAWFDARGREVGRADGVVVAFRDRLWRLTTPTTTDRSPSCAQRAANAYREPPAGRVTRTRLLLDARRDDRFDLDESYRSLGDGRPGVGYGDGEVGEVTTDAVLTGSLGRYLFVERRARFEQCGGRTTEARDAHVYDLRRLAPMRSLLDPATADRALRAGRRAIADEQRRRGVTGTGALVLDGHALVWGGGAPALRHRIWRACAGCGDTGWGDGALATLVDAATLPQSLVDELDWLDAPAGALRSLDGAEAGGLSAGVPGPAWRKAFGVAEAAVAR